MAPVGQGGGGARCTLRKTLPLLRILAHAIARGTRRGSVAGCPRIADQPAARPHGGADGSVAIPFAQAIFRLQSAVCELFRGFLSSQGFTEIHSPKLVGTASEGGADVFRVEYFGGAAYLAQSPQLYKQMALMADLDRVFEVRSHACTSRAIPDALRIRLDSIRRVGALVDALLSALMCGVKAHAHFHVSPVARRPAPGGPSVSGRAFAHPPPHD